MGNDIEDLDGDDDDATDHGEETEALDHLGSLLCEGSFATRASDDPGAAHQQGSKEAKSLDARQDERERANDDVEDL
jgi:hypothetical protein